MHACQVRSTTSLFPYLCTWQPVYFFPWLTFCYTFRFALFPQLVTRICSIMVRQSRQKRHLKRLNAMKQAAVRMAFSADEEEDSSSGDDVLWSDNDLDPHTGNCSATYLQSVHHITVETVSGLSSDVEQRGKDKQKKMDRQFWTFFRRYLCQQVMWLWMRVVDQTIVSKGTKDIV